MKEIMISIRPEWCDKIVSGIKTVEIRKSKPKEHWRDLDGLLVYVYCTQGKDTLIDIIRDGEDVYGTTYHGKPVFIKTPGYCPQYVYTRRGYVIGEFTCKQIEELTGLFDIDPLYRLPDNGDCCLTVEELEKYGNGKRLYGWHIDDFKGYDRPKMLSEFGLKRPPQSWCYIKR